MTVSNRKSIRQVLKTLYHSYSPNNETLAIAEALAALEEIMVAAKPERERATGDLDSDYVHGKHEGWNDALDQYEQNIRQAFSNGGGE